MYGTELSKLRYFEILPERLIVSNIMAWEGAIAVSAEEDFGCIGSSRFLSYTPSENIDIRYLNYFFQSSQGQRAIRKTSTGTVLRNQTLSIKDFEDLLVPLPDSDEQRRIATRLDSSSSRIAAVQTAREHAQTLREALRHSVLSRAGMLRPLGEVIRRANSEEPVDPSKTYDIAGVYGFGRGLFERGPMQGNETSYQKLNRLSSGRLVMSRLKAFEGALAIIPREFDGWYLSPEFPTFEIDTTRADERYLMNICMWPGLWERLSGQSKGIGARKVRVSADRLLSTEVPLPALDEQRLIADQLDKLNQSKALSIYNDTNIESLSSALLNAAFGSQL
ncbi:restriction endonuclease subunit S [Actinoallomurus liliacearum]